MKTLYARPLLAAILTATLVGGPVSPAFGQDPPQNPPAAPAKPATPIEPVSLGSAKHNYTRAPKPFPNLFAPYSPIKIAAPVLTNSPRIDQLIHDGKLELSMQEAVELALENSMDIVVQRYHPWSADAGSLNANARGSEDAGVREPRVVPLHHYVHAVFERQLHCFLHAQLQLAVMDELIDTRGIGEHWRRDLDRAVGSEQVRKWLGCASVVVFRGAKRNRLDGGGRLGVRCCGIVWRGPVVRL